MSCNPYFNLDSTSKDLEASVLSISVLFNQQNDSALKYNSGFLNSAIAGLSDFVDIILNHPEYDFPMLVDRIRSGPITPTEYADFLDATATLVTTVPLVATYPLSISAIDYLTNIDAHYTTNFASSTDSLCTTFNGLLKSVFKILDKINNIISSVLSIKNLLHGLIDKIKSKLTKTINQLTSKITAGIGSIKALADKVKKATDFFSDLNVSTLKDIVSNAISSAANKFKSITADNILYLTYRFCQLSNAVEQFMKAPLKSLQDDLKNAENIKNVIFNNSQQFTLDAITSGAFRISDINADEIKKNLAQSLNFSTSGSNSSIAAPSVNGAGQATPSSFFSEPPTDEEKSIAASIIATPADQMSGSSHAGATWFDFSTIGDSMDNIIPGHPELKSPGIGVKNLNPNVLILGIRVSKVIGKRLEIKSGFRSPEYNQYIRQKAIDEGLPKSQWPAKDSAHKTGLAMDVIRSSFGTDFASGEAFIKTASQHLAGGIGTYKTFIHIDVASVRKWTAIDDHSQMSHWPTLINHVAGNFIHGTPPSPNLNTPQ